MQSCTAFVLHQGSIERYNGQDTARVQLAPIPEGGSQAVRVWILCRQPGRLALGAVLQCPAVVSQVVEFDVEEPFEHRWDCLWFGLRCFVGSLLGWRFMLCMLWEVHALVTASLLLSSILPMCSVFATVFESVSQTVCPLSCLLTCQHA